MYFIPKEAGWTWFDLQLSRYQCACGDRHYVARLIVCNFSVFDFDSNFNNILAIGEEEEA